jgi:hypothetical protein
MRKPRDIDAELKALQDRAKGLRARRVTQLGELVLATGADQLAPEVLAGVLLAAAARSDAADHEAWRGRGEEFFRQQGRARKAAQGPARGGAGDAAGGSRPASD